MTYKIIRGEDEKTFEDEDQFTDMVQLLEEQDVSFETERPDETTEVVDAEPVEEPEETEVVTTEKTVDAIDELGESLGTDPLDILPSHMIDHIKGQPAVNKRGYAMIAERYGIETKAEVLEYPWENEDNRAVAKAIAKTEDGKEYSGWATASAEDGDMEDQLIELSETRALKRSVSWASGVGIVSYQEMADELER